MNLLARPGAVGAVGQWQQGGGWRPVDQILDDTLKDNARAAHELEGAVGATLYKKVTE